MIVLVPISIFRVHYQVAQGSPYSQLDRFILQSVSEGYTSITDLQKIFYIHQRLLIQSLITLIQAGWLALGSGDNQFVITLAGRDALQKSSTLPDSIVVQSRRTQVLLERVTGGVLSKNEVFYTNKAALRTWGQYKKITPYVSDNRIDEGQVRHMLPLKKEQRIHWVEKIEMENKGSSFVPVDVDLDQGELLNWPQRYKMRLWAYVEDEVKESSSTAITSLEQLDLPKNIRGEIDKQEYHERLLNAFSVKLKEDDLIRGISQNNAFLKKVLCEVHSRLVIVSEIINIECMNELKTDIIEALDRGVSIDILWGYGNETEVVNQLKKLRYDLRDKPGRFEFNHKPTSSTATYLIWDDDNSVMKCVIGNFNWLAVVSEVAQDVQYSVKTDHPDILSQLSIYTATLFDSQSGVSIKWRKISSNLDMCSVPLDNIAVLPELYTDSVYFPLMESNDKHTHSHLRQDCYRQIAQETMRLIKDRDHTALLQDFCKSAQSRLLLAISKLDINILTQLTLASKCWNENADFECKIVYGDEEWSEDDEIIARQKKQSIPATFYRLTGLNTSFIISDTSVCITNYKLLANPDRKYYGLSLIVEGYDTLVNHLVHDVMNAVPDNLSSG